MSWSVRIRGIGCLAPPVMIVCWGGMATTSSPAGLAAISSSGSTGTRGVRVSPAIDTITDFHPEQGDKIDLADMLQGGPGASVESLLNNLSASVTTGSNGLSDVSLSVAPAGDGQVTQQITLKDVDLSSWHLATTSSHDVLQSMLDNHSLIIQHP